MTFSKRMFDLWFALLLFVILSPALILIGLGILIRDGRPVMYKSERMRTPDIGFTLWKFRTMTTDNNNSGVSGGDKMCRITRSGRFLRRLRLDELPQLINIIRGDMSFVGPRPPLREYTRRFPGLYRDVLRARPGVTGLATLVMHGFEARVLEVAKDSAETDRLYCQRCVPRKARLDILYRDNQSFCFDLVLIGRTLKSVFGAKNR